jgi:hypothetical protein
VAIYLSRFIPIARFQRGCLEGPTFLDDPYTFTGLEYPAYPKSCQEYLLIGALAILDSDKKEKETAEGQIEPERKF